MEPEKKEREILTHLNIEGSVVILHRTNSTFTHDANLNAKTNTRMIRGFGVQTAVMVNEAKISRPRPRPGL